MNKYRILQSSTHIHELRSTSVSITNIIIVLIIIIIVNVSIINVSAMRQVHI